MLVCLLLNSAKTYRRNSIYFSITYFKVTGSPYCAYLCEPLIVNTFASSEQ